MPAISEENPDRGFIGINFGMEWDPSCPSKQEAIAMIHCQNCTIRNSLDREFCWKCGSKLLVTSGAVPLDATIPFMDEHVLERISALEYSINMLTRRVRSEERRVGKECRL